MQALSPAEWATVRAHFDMLADVSPGRGVIHGWSSHTLDVAVTVQPASELAAALGQTQSQSQSQLQTQGQSQTQSQS